jgi:acetylornithine deacetylase/succinyl-diaminopimelate desuccinylase-like protein
MRKLTVSLTLLAVASVIVIATALSRSNANVAQSAVSFTRQQAAATTANPASTIDGAVNPEQIPDHVAYSLFFRFIAGRHTIEEKNRIRAYIRQMGLEASDVEALIAAAEEFQQQVGALDDQAAEIKDRHFYEDADGNYYPNGTTPSKEERVQLKQLQKQKEAVVIKLASSLRQRLSADGMVKVRQHINDHFKRRVKMKVNEQQN